MTLPKPYPGEFAGQTLCDDNGHLNLKSLDDLTTTTWDMQLIACWNGLPVENQKEWFEYNKNADAWLAEAQKKGEK
jgi:hypothetical protein